MHHCVQDKAVIKVEDSNFMEQLVEFSRGDNSFISPFNCIGVVY